MASWSYPYNQLWEWFADDGVEKLNFYWADFNPTRPQWDWDWTVTYASTSYDLSWFQPWHEVLCWIYYYTVTWYMAETTVTAHMDFLRSNDWSSWETWWYETFSEFLDENLSWYSTEYQRGYYVWVDYDEIWTWYRYYKFHYYASWYYDLYSPTFTVSNLNIDDTRHPAWFLWVDWNHLCYTDGIHWTTWYKHKIAYDWNYNSYVGTEYSWMLWLDPTTTRKIYYVDEYWYKRRTYAASDWLWGSQTVSTNKKWAIRVPTWWGNYWYWHLCFVTNNWDKLRILNWPPAWVV